MSTVTVPNFEGGLSKKNSSVIDDNQFEKLLNFFYDSDKRVRTRYGYRRFGQPVPDSVSLIDACNSTSGWAVDDDATTLAAGTAIRGSNSISFAIDVSASAENFATLERNNYTLDLSNDQGALGFWLYVPSGFNTNLTDVRVRLSSDSSTDYDSATNYYEWTLPTLTEDENNFVFLQFSDATTQGSPSISAIKYFGVRVNYTASYTDKAGVLVDSIYAYSPNSTKPTTSYLFHRRDDTLLNRAIVFAGENAFLYHEELGTTADMGYWEVIDTGLTEFETAEGRTTERTRWSGDVYKNVFYMCNGIDDYRSWNDITISTFGAQPKVRYVEYLDDGDRMAGAGDDENPISLYYTDAAQSDAETLNANTVVVGGDLFGKINGLKALGQVFLVGKDRKKYAVDVAGTNAPPLDASNGWFSQRSLHAVGRGILHLTERGIEEVTARNALSGASAMEDVPRSDDLQPYFDTITEKQRNANCGFYEKKLKNYYFTFDNNGDNKPEQTIVRSALVDSWSEYTWPALYDYGEYTDNDNVRYMIGASANGGQLYQLETGFDDDGTDITYELITKAWDFNDPASWKDFRGVEITGLKSLGKPIYLEVLGDGEIIYSVDIDDSFVIDTSTPSVTIGSNAIGTEPITGGQQTESMPMFQYFVNIGPVHFASGRTIQIRMYSDESPLVWTFDKLKLNYEMNTDDVIPLTNQA